MFKYLSIVAVLMIGNFSYASSVNVADHGDHCSKMKTPEEQAACEKHHHEMKHRRDAANRARQQGEERRNRSNHHQK